MTREFLQEMDNAGLLMLLMNMTDKQKDEKWEDAEKIFLEALHRMENK